MCMYHDPAVANFDIAEISKFFDEVCEIDFDTALTVVPPQFSYIPRSWKVADGSVVLPPSIQALAEEAFYNLDEHIEYMDLTNVREIEDYAFEASDVDTIYLHDCMQYLSKKFDSGGKIEIAIIDPGIDPKVKQTLKDKGISVILKQ